MNKRNSGNTESGVQPLTVAEMNNADFGKADADDTFDVNDAAGWNTAVNGINSGGGTGVGDEKCYVINITGDFSLAGTSSATFSSTHIKVSIRGTKTITLSSDGNLLRTKANQSIIIRDTTLTGKTANTAAVVRVDGGSVTMKGASKITGNTVGSVNGTSASGGGGVLVSANATFTMNDSAAVSGNTVSSVAGISANGGGGVNVAANGTFTMNDSAAVSGNTVSSVTGTTASGGGGVYVLGTFTMHDSAAVSSNTVSVIDGTCGGGVLVNNGIFTMNNNARVYSNSGNNNTATGGVAVYGTGAFTMNDNASVWGNDAANSTRGGGVTVRKSASFTMAGGTIYGNTASTNGGGVYFDTSGTFTMTGGVIRDNTATNGGGVYISYEESGTFTKTGGTIYGDEPDNNAYHAGTNANTATSASNTTKNGHAVMYHDGTNYFYRNGTLGTSDGITNAGVTTGDLKGFEGSR